MNVKQIQKKLAKKARQDAFMDLSKYQRDKVLRDTYIIRHKKYGRMTAQWLVGQEFRELQKTHAEELTKLRAKQEKKESNG